MIIDRLPWCHAPRAEMTDGASQVARLVQRAVRAGAAPGAMARWGTLGSRDRLVVEGVSSVVPVPGPVIEGTWFDLASLTKPLVTTPLALVAFRSGDFGLGTRVDELLHELRGSPVGGLEVERLLTHTSGLPAWLPLYCLAEGRREALVERLGRVTLEAPPRERVIYSCIGFVILGLMLERLAGETLDRLFHREVASVLGIGDELGFCPDPETRSLCGSAVEPRVERRLAAAAGHDPRWVPSVGPGLPDDGNARFLGGVAGNAGLFGTAGGVAVVAAEFLPGGGQLLTGAEAAAATMHRTPGLGQGRGLGWQLASTAGCAAGSGLSHDAFGHTGFTGVSVWCDPVHRSVFVLLTNRNHPGQRENDLHPLRRRFHALAASGLNGAAAG
jgi:CubicO group peptidase (beta-lactamase class C family)